MTIYKNIILAIDLHPHYDEYVAEKAYAFSQMLNAKLYLMHAIEPLNTFGVTQGYEIIMRVEKEIADNARIEMKKLALKHNIPEDQQIIITGSPEEVILEQVKKRNVDLIIVGTRGRHGLKLLLGSVADGLIHKATCDVLAIHTEDKS